MVICHGILIKTVSASCLFAVGCGIGQCSLCQCVLRGSGPIYGKAYFTLQTRGGDHSRRLVYANAQQGWMRWAEFSITSGLDLSCEDYRVIHAHAASRHSSFFRFRFYAAPYSVAKAGRCCRTPPYLQVYIFPPLSLVQIFHHSV